MTLLEAIVGAGDITDWGSLLRAGDARWKNRDV